MVKKLITRTEFARLAGVSGAAVTKACKSALLKTLSGKRIDVNHPDAARYLEKKAQAQTDPAATGLDPYYEHVVKYCLEENRYSINAVQKKFRIGYERARGIIAIMKVNGLIPEDGKSKKSDEEVPKKEKKPHIRGTDSAKRAKKSASLSALASKIDDLESSIIEIPEDIQAFADMTLRELIQRFGTDTAFADWLSATQKIEMINEKRLKNAQTKGTLISRRLVEIGVIDVFNSAHLRLLKDGAKSIAAGAVSKHASGAELSEIEAFVSDILGSFIKPIKNKITRALKNA